MTGEAFIESNQTQSEDYISDNCNSSSSKDKKKKRRSRRTKQNSTCLADNSICTTPVRDTQSSGGKSTSRDVGSHDHQLSPSSDVEFDSLPNMPTDRLQCEHANLENPQSIVPGTNGRLFFNSCPENIGRLVSEDSNLEADISSHYLSKGHAKRKLYTPHWPEEAVTKALEKGSVFKALFRVNAYNKNEAYCKIDGLPTDVLIYGLVAQNRAIDGDFVAIRVDHPSRWSKMKGLNGMVESSISVKESLRKEAANIVEDSLKGKCEVAGGLNHANGGNSLVACKNGYYDGESVGLESVGLSDKCYSNRLSSSKSYSHKACGSNGGDEAADALANLCAAVNSFASKRPTGSVVCILEMSPRRDAVVGFLGVKQFIRNWETSIKDTTRKKQSSSALNDEHIMLMPTEPKFPRMMVPLRNMPEFLKTRLEAGDATVEMDLVAARIVSWEEETTVPQAHVINSFGRGGQMEARIAAILFENAINISQFSPEALSCLPTSSWEVPLEEVRSRKDLRNLCIFTIDPSTATDLDDALSVEILSDGTSRVGVHIADVSYFVLPDTALDIDAQIRSTSVYMLQRKLPMLPPMLSENLGSLNPGVDRLAFSMFWDIDPDGEVLDRWIGRTVIRSCCKLSYEHAEQMVRGLFDAQSADPVPNGWPVLYGSFDWSDVVESVRSIHEISRNLKARRFNDGALAIRSPKVAFLFDKDGSPYDSLMCGGKESNFLVEEFMLLANRTAAEVITRAYPYNALLRRHPEPNQRKLKEFEAFCGRNGFKLDVSSSAQFHHSLECIRAELEDDAVLFDIVMSYATKAMQLASYFCPGDFKDGTDDWRHYGLGIPLYTHFTSPLRRYPDIVVHRMLGAIVEAEEMYLRRKEVMGKLNPEELMSLRCFTGISSVKEIVESYEAQELLSAVGSKLKIPCKEIISNVASHCNGRKLAARHVKDSIDKLYMWVLLKKKEMCVEARVMGLGPRFMSIYIPKLAVERRICYDDVDCLAVEWLDATSTLVLSRHPSKIHSRKGNLAKLRRLEEVALVVSPCDSMLSLNTSGHSGTENCDSRSADSGVSRMTEVAPAVFPLTLRVLCKIPVALHAVGGDDGPVDIGARLYVSSYFK
ncbi:OLC1v1015357C1 [Oldenlandia corymbosa var. corymbosa]|uniref:DIS3-like exonuclease 2 n=1 Tax=Oldenlandia corymbosa var. corymbosa TaxID=529605 RepID=A0AAV1E393_OLDCO|nr:OLC1v1015357C1 [Oldenlandia corymbosa var. corymbosa]